MMVAPLVAAAGISAGADLLGGLADQYFSQKAGDQAWKRQKKVLQNQIQWRTADAIAAGLHPLAALGLSPATGPSAVVDSIGDDISRMGANIGRAAEAYLTPEDKLAARLEIATVERAEAERDLVRSQVAGAQKALLTHGATPGVASGLPVLPGDPLLGLYNKDPEMNKRLQDRHGEMADVMTAPHSVVEVLAQPGNMLDPGVRDSMKSSGQEVLSSIGRGMSTLRQWYTPGGWNDYWR